MNLKTAQIAWNIAMEHMQVGKALQGISSVDVDDYNAAKKDAFKLVYGKIMRVIDMPVSADTTEFLSKMLDEERPESKPECSSIPMIERVRDFVRSRVYSATPVATSLRAADVLERARSMRVDSPNLNEACAEIAILQDRIRVLEKALRNAAIELP
jgi:hypothetical protein